MIYVDDRVGSGELVELFESGLAVAKTRLNFGDFYFLGKGNEGYPVPIGIERKTISDLITSMVSGRLAGHQLPGLLNSYVVVYLVVEGIWRREKGTGALEVLNCGRWQPYQYGYRTYRHSDIFKFIHTLAIMSARSGRRFIYIPTSTKQETVDAVTDLYKWWTCKDFEEHRGHKAIYDPYISIIDGLIEQPPVQRVAQALGHGCGVGAGKAQTIAKHFSSVKEMCLASEKEWTKIHGIGKILAKAMYNEINKEVKVEDK